MIKLAEALNYSHHPNTCNKQSPRFIGIIYIIDKLCDARGYFFPGSILLGARLDALHVHVHLVLPFLPARSHPTFSCCVPSDCYAGSGSEGEIILL